MGQAAGQRFAGEDETDADSNDRGRKREREGSREPEAWMDRYSGRWWTLKKLLAWSLCQLPPLQIPLLVCHPPKRMHWHLITLVTLEFITN